MNIRHFAAALGFAATLAVSAFATAARADGDAEAGKRIFAQCGVCHSTEAGKTKIGPSLHGIIGRKAGTEAHFKTYSPAMKNSGIVWTEDNLKKYLADPKAFVPGNRMVYPGVKKPQDVENVVAYLKQATK